MLLPAVLEYILLLLETENLLYFMVNTIRLNYLIDFIYLFRSLSPIAVNLNFNTELQKLNKGAVILLHFFLCLLK